MLGTAGVLDIVGVLENLLVVESRGLGLGCPVFLISQPTCHEK